MFPMIPGCNDSEENIKATFEFIRGFSSLVDLDLIPAHRLGKAKYDSLNRDYPKNDIAHIPASVLQNTKRHRNLRIEMQSSRLKSKAEAS